MKKIVPIVAVFIVAVCVIAGTASSGGAPEEENYIRLHIRANSNEAVDQEVKYKVRNSVLTALSGAANEVESKAEMYGFLQRNLSLIEKVANEKLQAEASVYRAKAYMRQEEFPARTYDGVTLEAGVYDALIIELGKAEGQNWWCVVYPQLCFVPKNETDSADFKYKSIIEELINGKKD